MYGNNPVSVVLKQNVVSEHGAGVAEIVGEFVGVGFGVFVGVGEGTQLIQLPKSGSPKSGPPGPENSTKE